MILLQAATRNEKQNGAKKRKDKQKEQRIYSEKKKENCSNVS